jgi:hypothetical protein
MAIKKVEMWQTSDGRHYVDEAAAIEAQRELDMRKALGKFVNRHGYDEMQTDDLLDMLIEYVDELRGIIKED